MKNDILIINGLTKSFGMLKIINSLDFSVPEGSIFGFIGQNGAGKTTTMKIALGLLEADSGSIQICGEITGLTKLEINNRSDELLSLVGLEGVNKRIGGFSRGMKQRLGIAQALLSQPKLLICDEPTSALDPVGRKEILEILQKIRGTTTVIFSTHILSDVERICDQVAVLHGGSIAISGSLSDIKAKHGRDSLLLEFAQSTDLSRFKAIETIIPLLSGAEQGKMEIILHSTDISQIQRTVITALAESGLCPVKTEIQEPSLENLFLGGGCMSGYIAFTKKEMTESIRNYRLLSMMAIFLFFGVGSPLLAKFTPDIMEMAMPSLVEAFENPTALDSWTQFYNNVASLGFSFTIILFSNCLSSEYSKGTLAIMLTKGLSRRNVILAKFSVSAIIITVCYWLSFGINYGYTAYLWPEAALPYTFLAAFIVWLSGILHLCILILGCVLFRQAFSSIIFLFVVTAVMTIFGQMNLTADYSPSFLIINNLDLLSGNVAAASFIVPIVITAVVSVTLLIVSAVMFSKKQL